MRRLARTDALAVVLFLLSFCVGYTAAGLARDTGLLDLPPCTCCGPGCKVCGQACECHDPGRM